MKKANRYLMICLAVGLFAVQLKAGPGSMAHAKMMSRSGSNAEGSFDFKDTPQGLEIAYDLTGLPKSQTVGIHIHERGDCSSPDAKSAGGHFAKVAPTGGTSQDFPAKYAGDLPSIQTDEFGKAAGTLLVSDLAVYSGHSIKDRAIVIHGGPDNINAKSASRIACGKIETHTKAR